MIPGSMAPKVPTTIPAAPVGSTVYTIFDTTQQLDGSYITTASLAAATAQVAASNGYAMPRHFFALHGIKRFLISCSHDQTIVFDAYVSMNRGLAWTQLKTDSKAATAATAADWLDYVVEGYPDWKLLMTPGTTITSRFSLTLAFSDERGAAV